MSGNVFSKLAALCLLMLLVITNRVSVAQESDPDLLQVGETLWGFDGRAQLHTFVPLTIEVQNLSPTPWHGRLRLRRVVRGERQFGATLAHDISLQGDETRWVQMIPYVVDDLEDWELSWGPGKTHKADLPPVVKGDRATVLIYDSDAVKQDSTVFKRLSEERFPTSVTALDGLRGVILDRVPFWQGAHARAFQDWITLGGRVYLLHNSDDKFPEFPATLSFLNSEQSQFQIGLGTVKKLPFQAEEFSIDEAKLEIFNDDWSAQEQKAKEKLNNSRFRQPQGPSYSYDGWQNVWSKNYDIVKELSELAKYKRNWAMIYLFVIIYLATLFPGCFRIGTVNKRVGQFYVVFLSASVFFAISFTLMGQVGERSANRIRSAQLARSLGDGSFDVTGWTVLANVFASDREVSQPGSGIQFTTTQEAEHVRGEMLPASGGVAKFQMLPDSRQPLLHRARVRTDRPIPKVVAKAIDEQSIQALKIDATGAFENAPLFAVVAYRGEVYEVDINGFELDLKRKRKQAQLTTFLQRPYEFGYQWGPPPAKDPDEEEEEEETLTIELKAYKNLIRPLVGNSYGLIDEIDVRKLKASKSVMRLFVLTKTPSEMQIQADDFPDQMSATLFSFDLGI